MWKLIGILFVYKIFSGVLKELSREIKIKNISKLNLAILIVISILGTYIGIVYISPMFFNTLFNFLGFCKVIGWKEAFMLDLAIALGYIHLITKNKEGK